MSITGFTRNFCRPANLSSGFIVSIRLKIWQSACRREKAAVFFSATLLPLRYYRMLLSDQEEDYTVYVPSPFPQERRLLLAATDVTSRYTRRNEVEYRRVLRYIQVMASVKKGNYIVFFPVVSVYEPGA